MWSKGQGEQVLSAKIAMRDQLGKICGGTVRPQCSTSGRSDLLSEILMDVKSPRCRQKDTAMLCQIVA